MLKLICIEERMNYKYKNYDKNKGNHYLALISRTTHISTIGLFGRYYV